MILIADSGTTKTEWGMVSPDGTVGTLATPGINPFYQEGENIRAILQNKFTGQKKYEAIHFYGAGCINEEKQNIVKVALLQVFDTKSVFVGSDLMAAARSLCRDRPGIACILGTGSNSCYYNGSEIAQNVSSLGYILGDEGSGAVLGKRLIGDVLKRQLPKDLTDSFFADFHTTATEILENVYRKPFPSRYLAGYTKFLSKNIGRPEIQNIVISSFSDFVARNLLQYPDVENTLVHFTGSIAFHFEAQLRNVIEKQHLKLGVIERSPMAGLIGYHRQKII